MQALVGGAVDYAATSFDVALQAFANDAPIRRVRDHRPAAVVRAGGWAGRSENIADLKGLEGRTVGVSALGNADHTMLLYLLAEAGADAGTIEFAVLDPNLFEALRRGQVDAGMVQEPALTLIVEDGGKVLFNAMDIADSTRLLGGAYEFMGRRLSQRGARGAPVADAGDRPGVAASAGAAHGRDRRDSRVAAGRTAGRRRRRALPQPLPVEIPRPRDLIEARGHATSAPLLQRIWDELSQAVDHTGSPA